MYQSILDERLVLHHQKYPIENRTINRHIEQCWQYDPPLCNTAGRPGLWPMITILPGDYFLIIQKFCQEYLYLQARIIPLQGL